MDLQIMIIDYISLKAITWTVALDPGLLPDTQLMEFICLENEAQHAQASDDRLTPL